MNYNPTLFDRFVDTSSRTNGGIFLFSSFRVSIQP